MKQQIISILIVLLIFVACSNSESNRKSSEKKLFRQDQLNAASNSPTNRLSHLHGEWEYIETYSITEDGTENLEIISEFSTYLHPTLTIDRDGTMRARFYTSFIGDLVETETNIFSFENVIWQSEGEEGDHDYPIFLEYFPETGFIRYNRDYLVDYFRKKTHKPAEIEIYLHTGPYKNNTVNVIDICYSDASSPNDYHLILTSDKTIYYFSYLAIMADVTDDEQIVFQQTEKMVTIDKLTAYHEFVVNWIGIGTFPHRAISFVETDGTQRFYAINQNHADPEEDSRGPIFLTEIKVKVTE
jgi:hypothetical protein